RLLFLYLAPLSGRRPRARPIIGHDQSRRGALGIRRERRLRPGRLGNGLPEMRVVAMRRTGIAWNTRTAQWGPELVIRLVCRWMRIVAVRRDVLRVSRHGKQHSKHARPAELQSVGDAKRHGSI